MLTLDGIDPSLQNFKNLELLKIEKWLGNQNPRRSCKSFYLNKNQKNGN